MVTVYIVNFDCLFATTKRKISFIVIYVRVYNNSVHDIIEIKSSLAYLFWVSVARYRRGSTYSYHMNRVKLRTIFKIVRYICAALIYILLKICIRRLEIGYVEKRAEQLEVEWILLKLRGFHYKFHKSSWAKSNHNNDDNSYRIWRLNVTSD